MGQFQRNKSKPRKAACKFLSSKYKHKVMRNAKNTQEIRGSDSWNFETLKYNTSNESNDILLDDAYDADLHSFSKNVKNLEC